MHMNEYFFLPTFQSGFSKSIRTISKGFPKCFHILQGFKAFQNSRNCFKYSEKQISFSNGNLYNLHLLSNSSPTKTWLSTRFSLPHRYHFDGSLLGRNSTELKEPQNQVKCGDMLTPKISQIRLAYGAGNAGWSHMRLKLVCCEAWWLCSNNVSLVLRKIPASLQALFSNTHNKRFYSMSVSEHVPTKLMVDDV